MTEEDVRRIATGLPDVVERPSYGTPAWFVGGRLFARIHESGDLMVRVADEGEKHALLDEDPAVFWTTPHYDGYASVLVHLDVVPTDLLSELLTDAWRLRAKVTLRRAHPDL